jgi:hypothetical protein
LRLGGSTAFIPLMKDGIKRMANNLKEKNLSVLGAFAVQMLLILFGRWYRGAGHKFI